MFATVEHPLVLFLDDLQWADAASLQLLPTLLTPAPHQALLVIGAYRETEVGAGHPLLLTVQEIAQAGTILNRLVLAPLDFPAVTQLLADTLHCSPERAGPLAELLLSKLGGNPFFLCEFLKSLSARQLLTFVPPTSILDSPKGTRFSILDLTEQSKVENRKSKIGWQWDLPQIQAQAVTANVVELLAGRVQQLPPATQRIVQLAACIGHRFDLATLALVADQPPRAAAADLWAALAAELVVPLSDAYKVIDLEVEGLAEATVVEYQFAHDRVQQAVYALIPQKQKPRLHLAISRLLLAQANPVIREERLFDIVDQLHLGSALLTEQTERDELAELNLRAGRKAKAATAYGIALQYLTAGRELLSAERWAQQYELTLALTREAAEAAYLSINFALADTLAVEVLSHARAILDQVAVYEIQITAYTMQNRMLDALELPARH